MKDMEGVQFTLADMTSDIECSALAVYRAAWVKDVRGVRGTREASMAKLVASEAANRVVDRALQLFGGLGVTKGNIIEQLYRDVRPMRLYEGRFRVQKLIIARNFYRKPQRQDSESNQFASSFA
jgi:acyl-CoA dehydrogenase